MLCNNYELNIRATSDKTRELTEIYLGTSTIQVMNFAQLEVFLCCFLCCKDGVTGLS